MTRTQLLRKLIFANPGAIEVLSDADFLRHQWLIRAFHRKLSRNGGNYPVRLKMIVREPMRNVLFTNIH